MDVPLQSALDWVCSLYPTHVQDEKFHYTWGERKSGVFLIHFALDKPAPQAAADKPAVKVSE